MEFFMTKLSFPFNVKTSLQNKTYKCVLTIGEKRYVRSVAQHSIFDDWDQSSYLKLIDKAVTFKSLPYEVIKDRIVMNEKGDTLGVLKKRARNQDYSNKPNQEKLSDAGLTPAVIKQARGRVVDDIELTGFRATDKQKGFLAGNGSLLYLHDRAFDFETTDLERCFQILGDAWKNGHPTALHNMIVITEEKGDFEAHNQLLHLGVLTQCPTASYQLGFDYFDKNEEKEALKCFKKSAEAMLIIDPDVCRLVAVVENLDGSITRKNEVSHWYNGMKSFVRLIHHEDSIPEEHLNLYKTCLLILAHVDPDSIYWLSIEYKIQRAFTHPTEDPLISIELLKKAAALGQKNACEDVHNFALNLYREGMKLLDIEPEVAYQGDKVAIEMFMLIKDNEPNAYFNLALMYIYGRGCHPDLDQATSLYKEYTLKAEHVVDMPIELMQWNEESNLGIKL